MNTWSYQYVSEYLKWLRPIIEHLKQPGATVKIDWAGEDLDVQGFRRKLHQALDKRINLKAGPEPCWRKLDPLYQVGLMRDQRRLQDHAQRRIIIRQFETPEIRRRFGHILERD